MTRLRQILAEYSDDVSPAHAGGAAVRPMAPPAGAPIPATLLADLKEVQAGNRWYFRTCVAMILLLYLATIVVVLLNLRRPDILKVTTAIFGVSAPALVLWMIGLWREKVATETILVFAAHGDAPALRKLMSWWDRRLKTFP